MNWLKHYYDIENEKDYIITNLITG